MIVFSTDNDKISPAFVELQKAVLVVVKGNRATKDGQTMYHYANLADVWEVIREPVAERDLSVLQGTGEIREVGSTLIVNVTTKLLHRSGQWVRDGGWYPIPVPTKMMNMAQALGSALSYARRYGICSLLGIVTGDDDDAKRAFAAAGRSAGPNVEDKPAMTWQAIHEAGTWRSEQNPDDRFITLGDLEPAELRKLMPINAKKPEPDPGIVAASAEMLMKACEKRGVSLPEALGKVHWKGATVLADLSPRDIILAFNAITAPSAPKTDTPSE